MYTIPDKRVNEMRSLVKQLINSKSYEAKLHEMMDKDESFNPLEYPVAVLNSLMATTDNELEERSKKRTLYEIKALVDHIFIPKLISLQSALGRELETPDIYALIGENSGIEITQKTEQ